RKLTRDDRRSIDIAVLAERPLIDVHGEPPLRSFRQPETGTGRSLGPQQTTAHRIADRGMRKEQLLRREARRIPLVDSRSAAKERDLETTFHALSIGEPTGDVPPFGPVRGMAAFIFRQ